MPIRCGGRVLKVWSLNPDTVIKTTLKVYEKEKKLKAKNY